VHTRVFEVFWFCFMSGDLKQTLSFWCATVGRKKREGRKVFDDF